MHDKCGLSDSMRCALRDESSLGTTDTRAVRLKKVIIKSILQHDGILSTAQLSSVISVPVYAVAVVADCPKSYIRGRLYPCRKRTARGKRKIIKIQIHRLAAPSFKLCYHCTPVRRICQYPLFTKRSGTLQAFPGKYGRKTLISGCFASMEAYPFTKQR